MRARFTIEEVQAAALEIVDTDGLGALSMRTLGSALGTGPMTLYNYVKNRDELEELVAEAVIADMRLAGRCDHWAAEVRAVAGAMWDGVRRHPNAVPLVLTLLAAFRAVLALIMGSVQVELAGPLASDYELAAAAAQTGTMAGENYSRLAALAEVSQHSTPEEDFIRGLDMLLAGFAPRPVA
jgi:AcrR family transcriptional regulator